MVVPVYVVLQKKLQKLLKRDIPDSPGGPDSPDVPASKYIETDFTVDAAEAALMKLDKYYNISSELCTIATVLDPRLKLDFYKADQTPSAENPQEIRSYVKFFYEKYYSTPLGKLSRIRSITLICRVAKAIPKKIGFIHRDIRVFQNFSREIRN